MPTKSLPAIVFCSACRVLQRNAFSQGILRLSARTTRKRVGSCVAADFVITVAPMLLCKNVLNPLWNFLLHKVALRRHVCNKLFYNNKSAREVLIFTYYTYLDIYCKVYCFHFVIINELPQNNFTNSWYWKFEARLNTTKHNLLTASTYCSDILVLAIILVLVLVFIFFV